MKRGERKTADQWEEFFVDKDGYTNIGSYRHYELYARKKGRMFEVRIILADHFLLGELENPPKYLEVSNMQELIMLLSA